MNRPEKEQLQYLLLQYMDGLATPQEVDELCRQVAAQPDDAVWLELLEELYEADQPAYAYQSAEWQPVIDALIRQNREQARRTKRGVIVRMMRVAAAVAAACLLVVLGAYWWWPSKTVSPDTPAVVQTGVIPAGTTGAVLTLSGGQQLVLDSMGQGVIAKEGQTSVRLEDGRLRYDPAGKTANEITYNTMTTPRGRHYALVLADGSKVWLNAASSITYPTAFAGKERQVAITGEAYFEVAKDAARPFQVSINGKSTVEVLGTQFNVNAYADEAAIVTTLVEGAVNVSDNGTRQLTLRPGQAAELAQQGASGIQLVQQANIAKALAWKNGLFYFESASLAEIMRQAARWYDIEVVYPTPMPKVTFEGKMTRDVTLEGFLTAMQELGVRYRLDGKRLLILPE